MMYNVLKTMKRLLLLLLCLSTQAADPLPRKLVWDHSLSWPHCWYRMYDVTDTNNIVVVADNLLTNEWQIPTTNHGLKQFYVKAANIAEESLPSNTVEHYFGLLTPMNLKIEATITVTLP